ncbi:rod shape-determining protein MreC [Acetanaerobacterium elongatum]|uniref:Cell shape-determining protein MreC n=1 Tax=Acetanaerobacterium elongatum TaxID=258515 RepID=A0A1H0CHY3_9FIRM|nr:rod shape-determining protein MreC [Acetanaerobacterium elongatum]SDN57528.1 rod shape-determining protein MreC [Acetanaerobacterium elongatum]
MNEFFKSKKFKILLGIAAVLFGFMLYTAMNAGFGNILSNSLGSVVSPLQKLSMQIASSANGFFEKIIYADKISEENETLREELRSMREKMVDYETYKAENEQYRQFLDLKKDNPDFVFETGMVIGRDPTDYFYSFTIDKGSVNGIELYDPVITPDGLVGRISEVSYTDSKVITLLNPGIDVGAFNDRTRDTGIISGELNLSKNGKCKMSYISRDSSASSGDIITTSGIGGVFPKGLIIGTISDIKTEAHGISLYAEIMPSANIAKVRDVFVITSFKGQNGTQPTPGDSASSTASSSSAATK